MMVTLLSRTTENNFLWKIMSKRDLITGKWMTRLKKRGRTQETTTCLYPKGYDSICETEHANSILGDIENICYTRRDCVKGDIYEGR